MKLKLDENLGLRGFLDERSVIVGVGPITIDPEVQKGTGTSPTHD